MGNLTGKIIKGYELQERIGAGSFGAVYRAHQASVRREVAIKIILPHFAAQPDFIRRFEREAQIVARLEHPHIVPLYDYWRDSDGAYLVMRYVKGDNLRNALVNHPFDLQRTILLLDQVASALSFAHRRQVIHRDLKPSNILLDEDGNTYVADFGIAKDISVLTANPYPDDGLPSSDGLSPEEVRNEPASPQTDIYSLGVLLYETLTGHHPFSKSTSVEQMYMHLNDSLPLITTLPPSVCNGVNIVIQKATAKNPSHRYNNVLLLASAFREASGERFVQAGENIVVTLTRREQEVLQLLAENHTNAEIAQLLVLESTTVKWYVKQIFAKLNVTNRVQAAVRARMLKLTNGTSSIPTLPSIEIPIDQIVLKNPYKGLFAFQTADQADFFGREAFIDKLIKRLGESTELSRFLAVIGPSGSGKSSLIKAGLIPKLLQGALPGSDRWFICEMEPRTHPLGALATTLSRLDSSQTGDMIEQLQRDPRGLLRASQSVLPNDGSQLMLVIDQFEEVFTLSENEEERIHFFNLIYEAVTNVRSRLVIIIALRADFYDRPLQYADFGELVRSRMETVLPLSADGLERAIVEPARRSGVVFEAGLAASIVSDVNYQPGALPLLQYALTELFDRQHHHLLTRTSYLNIGGAVGALARRADETYASMEPNRQAVAQQMFLHLVTLGEGAEDTRRRVLRADLLAITNDPDTLDEVIDTFAEVRLLSLNHDPPTRRPTVELAHEAILREWKWLRSWLDESRHDIRMERMLAVATEEWLQSQRDSAFVMRGSRLDQFHYWTTETHLVLSSKERDYLDASLTERERQTHTERAHEARKLELARKAAESAQRLRYLVSVLAVSLILVLGLSLFAMNSRDDALLQARIAFSRQLAAQAVTELQKPLGNDEYAALLAIRSLKLQYDLIADEALTEAADKLPLAALRGHTDEVYSVAFSPDGKRVVTSSADHTARIWDIATSQTIMVLDHADEVHVASFSPDGKFVLTGCDDHLLRLWEVATGQLVRTFSGHTDKLWALTFSPDGKSILSAGEDMQARLWDVAMGQQVQTFTGHAQSIRSVAFSPDGKFIVIGGYGNDATLWEVATHRELYTLRGHSEAVTTVAFSPDGKFVLTGSNDNTARLWSSATGQLLHMLVGHSNSVRSAVFSPDGKYVLTGSGDFTARLWDVVMGQQVSALRGHADKIWSVAFSPDGSYALTASVDRTAKLWDISGHAPNTFRGHTGEVHGLAVSPDGQYLLTSSADRTVIMWNIEKGTAVHTFTGYPDVIWSVAVSPNDKYMLMGGRDRTAWLWDIATGQKVRTFSGHSDEIYAVAFSPDSKYILTGSSDTTAVLWDVATGQQVRTFKHDNRVLSVAFSPDGKFILTGSNSDNTAWLWDVATGQQIRTFKHGSLGDNVWSVAFSPDGKYVLSGGTANTAIMWNIAGQPLHTFTGHKNTIYSLAFSPDGKQVLTGGADRKAILWDVITKQQLRNFSGHGNAIWSVAFLPSGKQIVTGSFDATMKLWETDYHNFLTTVCTRLFRDFTELEREQADISDNDPTCK